MILLFLCMIFESGLFPYSAFCEHAHDIAMYENRDLRACAGLRTHYGLPGVHTYSISVASRSYGISSVSFGYELYRENQITGSFGFNVIPEIRACGSIALLNYWVKDYSSRYGYTMHMSAYYDKNEFLIGAWLNNINMPHLYDTDALPLAYSVRSQYSLQDNLTCILAARGTHTQLPFFNAAVSWGIHEYVIAGAGANTSPLYFEYLLKMLLGHIEITYTGTIHEYLGLSHGMYVTFKL